MLQAVNMFFTDDSNSDGLLACPAAVASGQGNRCSDQCARDWSTGMHAGRTECFDHWYRAWFDYSVRFVCTISDRDEAFAMDVVQSACMHIAGRITPMTNAAQLHAWVHRVLLNATIDALRSEQRRGCRENNYVAMKLSPAASSDESTQRIAWLHQVLSQLPTAERDLLQLRFAHNISYARVADVLGAPSRGVVRSAVDSVLNMLRSKANKRGDNQ